MSSQAPSPVSAPKPSPFENLMQLSSGYMVSAALYVVTKLNIPDLLASGARSVAELAAEAIVNEDALYRVLRMLTSSGLFSEVGLRYFSLNPAGEPLRSDHPESLRDIVLWMSSPIHNRVYADMMHSVMTGAPAIEKTTGMAAFDYLDHDSETAAEFHAAMTNFCSVLLPPVLEAYDFSSIGTLVDIGGGHGFVLGSILQKYPKMRGVLFDLEAVVNDAQLQLEQLGVADRCRTMAGDFFVQIPTGGDAYIMQHIIHDWDDERAIKILRNVHRALEAKRNGKVLLLEGIITAGDEPTFLKCLDVEMLMMPGGRERTEDEYSRLLAAAGFFLSRVVTTSGSTAVIEGIAV